MMENPELKLSLEDTIAQKPEDDRIPVTNIPGVAEKLKDKLKDAGVLAVPESRVDKLATPYRVVQWCRYADLKVRFDDFWSQHGDAISKNLKIKGRKSQGGKPLNARRIAESNISISKLYQPVLAKLLKETVHTEILFFDGIEVFDYEKGKTAQIVGIFYYMPEIEFKGELNFNCARPNIPGLEDQLKIRYKELQREFRNLVDDPDGVISTNSSVKLDIISTLEGKPYKSATVKQQWLDVGGILSEELVAALKGRRVGDEFECTHLVTRHDPSNAGKELHSIVKIHGLQQIEIPEVDDDLVRRKEFSDLSSFNARFSKDYTEYMDNALKAAAVDHIMSQIIQGSRVPEVPQDWIELQVDHRISSALTNFSGDRKAMLQAHMCHTEDDLRHRMRGFVYNELMQRCAVKWYQKTFKVGVDEEGAFYASILDNIKWVDADEKRG